MNAALAQRIAETALQLDSAKTELAGYEESGAHRQARETRTRMITLEWQMSAALTEARQEDGK